MRNSKLFTATVVALSLALGGCASSLTGDTYSRDEARKVQTVRMGTSVGTPRVVHRSIDHRRQA